MDRASRTAQCSHNTIVLVLVLVVVLENPDRFAIRLTEQISCKTSVSLRSRNLNAPRTSTTTRTIPNFGIWVKKNSVNTVASVRDFVLLVAEATEDFIAMKLMLAPGRPPS